MGLIVLCRNITLKPDFSGTFLQGNLFVFITFLSYSSQLPEHEKTDTLFKPVLLFPGLDGAIAGAPLCFPGAFYQFQVLDLRQP